MHKVHTKIGEKLNPIVDDTYFDVVTSAEDAGKSPDKSVKGALTKQINELRNILEIAAQTHLITSLISEASIAREPAMLVPIQDRFKASAQPLTKGANGLKEDDVKKAIAQLLAFGQGDNSVFKQREHELAATVSAAQTIEGNAKIQRELDQAVSALVGETETQMKRGTAELGVSWRATGPYS